jgi:6-phospho-3-hexuloisomerase
MDNNTLTNKKAGFEENLKLAKEINPQQTEVLIHEIKAAKRIFVMAAGRSGLIKNGSYAIYALGVYHS